MLHVAPRSDQNTVFINKNFLKVKGVRAEIAVVQTILTMSQKKRPCLRGSHE